MFEKITLIIPTHNRPKYLSRILDYYATSDIKIVVCDSSKQPSLAKKYKNVKYEYYENHSFISKVNKCLKNVRTPYVVMCADDDFIVPNAIKSCIDFLEKHKDYSSVQGHYIIFDTDLKRYNPKYFNAVGLDVNSDDASERLKKIFPTKMPLFYAVHRTEVLKRCFEVSQELWLPFIEYAIIIISCIEGKHKVLPIFYCARENQPGSTKYQIPTLSEIITSKEHQKEYNSFIITMAQYLSKKEKIGLDFARQIISNIVDTHLVPDHKYLRPVLDNFVERISPTFGKFLRKTYAFIFIYLLAHMKKGFPFYDKKAKKDLEKIIYYLKKHNCMA